MRKPRKSRSTVKFSREIVSRGQEGSQDSEQGTSRDIAEGTAGRMLSQPPAKEAERRIFE